MGTVSKYTNKVYQFALSNWINLFAQDCLYHGKKGALRFAREFGYGLADFPQKEAEEEIKNTYSVLCVRLYNLKPPVNAKEWNGEMRKAMNKQRQNIMG